MPSNNKMFQKFLYQKASEKRVSIRDNNEFIAECRQCWKSLSESEKLKYSVDSKSNITETKSVSESESQSGPTCSSVPHLDDNESVKYNEEFEQKLIDRLVKYKSEEALMSTKIYFIASNVMCVVDNTYLPLEIGLVEYSIEAGIQNTFHSFINAGAVPLGYMYSALNHSKLHKIPIKDFVLASNRFYSIGTAILKTLANSRAEAEPLNQSVNPMIVFSIEDQMDQNVGSLDWLSIQYRKSAQTSGQPVQDWDIKVLNASNLLYNIYLKINLQRGMSLCRNAMTSSSFDYCKDTDCPFHENEECIECALGVAKRIAYNLTHSLLSVMRIKVSTNHFPKLEFDRKYRYYELNDLISGIGFETLAIDDQTGHVSDQLIIPSGPSSSNSSEESKASTSGSSPEPDPTSGSSPEPDPTSGSSPEPDPCANGAPKRTLSIGVGRGRKRYSL